MIDVSIVLPIYNESLAVPEIINDIHNVMGQAHYSYEIIVVDDKSTDNSIDAIKNCKNINLIQRERRGGSGAARKTGILHAKGNIIVMLDADGTYDPNDIPRLLSLFPEFDQVNGARMHEQGTVKLLRIPAKWFLRKLASYITQVDIPDLNTGFKAFKKDIMKNFIWLIPNGFSCVSTMTLAFLVNDFKVKWVPIEYYRRIGRSKFHPIKDTYNYLLTVIRICAYFDPLKIFIPLGAFFFFLGLVKSFIDIFWGYFQKTNFINIMFLLTGIFIWTIGILSDIIVRYGKAGLRLTNNGQ